MICAVNANANRAFLFLVFLLLVLLILESTMFEQEHESRNGKRDCCYCFGPERYGSKSFSRPCNAAMKQTPLCSVTAPIHPSW
jgi:hypothetical protein